MREGDEDGCGRGMGAGGGCASSFNKYGSQIVHKSLKVLLMKMFTALLTLKALLGKNIYKDQFF